MKKFITRLLMYFVGIGLIDFAVELVYSKGIESTIISGDMKPVLYVFSGALFVTILSLYLEKKEPANIE